MCNIYIYTISLKVPSQMSDKFFTFLLIAKFHCEQSLMLVFCLEKDPNIQCGT